MLKNKKGFVIEGVAIAIISILALFILPPNPISNALGVGVRPNKTVLTEKVELLTDKDGKPIMADGAYMVRRTISDTDTQQHVTFLEWIQGNIILVTLTILFLLATGGLGKIWSMWTALKADTKKIVHSVNAGLTAIDDPAKRQVVLDAMSKVQDSSTKQLVADLKKI